MTDARARRLGWAAFGVLLPLYAIGIATPLLIPASFPTSWGTTTAGSIDSFMLAMLAFPVVGVLITSREPRNRIGWLLLAIGAAWSITNPLALYATYGLAHPGSLPQPGVAAALTAGSWVPPIGLMVIFLILLFPDGRLPSPRWRPVAWVAGFAMAVVMVLITVAPGSLEESGFPVENPLGIDALRRAMGVLYGIIAVLPLSGVAAAVSLVLRFRRAHGTERLQLKWLTTAGAIVAATSLVTVVASLATGVAGDVPAWVRILQNLQLVSFVLIPVAIGFSILKYRLYEIDVVINRALVYAVLAAIITGVYVGVVVGIGALVGSRGNLFLSIVATALIAVAFQPLRERVRHFANRLVYGKRATPYEVLSRASERLGAGFALEDALPEVARLTAEATGASRAGVWLRRGDGWREAAAFPAGELRALLSGGDAPAVVGERVFLVRHRGETLGGITVAMPRNEALTSAHEDLLENLASQAGLMLRNVALLDELRASRQRLVAAQDEERRRLERNIHDGAQQQLVALAIKLGLAERLVARDAEKAERLLAELKGETQQTLDDLRDLARGIYPPLLADKGLPAALHAQARKSSIPVAVESDGIGRFSREAEAAVYFCILEALQNVAKYAGASRATVRLEAENGHLAFEVADDGRGFDPAVTPRGSGLQNMTDRLEALGGSVRVDSAHGRGTRVRGTVPVGEDA